MPFLPLTTISKELEMLMADKHVVHDEENLQWSDGEDDTKKIPEKFKFGLINGSKRINKVSVPFRLLFDCAHENILNIAST